LHSSRRTRNDEKHHTADKQNARLCLVEIKRDWKIKIR